MRRTSVTLAGLATVGGLVTLGVLAGAARGSSGDDDAVVRWALSYGPERIDTPALLAELPRGGSPEGGPAPSTDALVRVGESGRRALLRIAAGGGERSADAVDWLARAQLLEDAVERLGLDHDVAYLETCGSAGLARAHAILPSGAPDGDAALAWWAERRGAYRFAPAVDRYVPWERWADDRAPLRFRKRARVRIADSQGLVNPTGSVTIEAWVLWLNEKESGYLVADEIWPEMSPELPAERKGGFVLRRNARGDGTATLDLTFATAPNHWWSVESAPLAMTSEWQHIAVSCGGGFVRLFRDGELVACRSTAGLEYLPSATDVYIGCRSEGWPNRTTDFDLRAFRISEGARYDDAFVPDQRLAPDDASLVCLEFRGGTTELRDTAHGAHPGVIEGATLVPGYDPAALRETLRAYGGGGHIDVFEAERGGASAGWYLYERDLQSEGATMRIESADEPGAAGHWISVPFRVDAPGRRRVHVTGPGLEHLGATVSPFAWRIDDGPWRRVTAPLPTLRGIAGQELGNLTALGEVELAPGEHLFRVRLLARAGTKRPLWAFWLDALVLETLR